jgi:hypothetical protein
MGNEQRTFTTANRTAFEGMRIAGPRGYGNPERNTQTKMPGRVHLNFSGSWFRNTLNSDVFGVSMENLSFTGAGAASGPNVIGQNGTGTWYCLQMRDIYSANLRSVVGSQATKVLLTAAQFDGSWEINNCYNGAFHIGGSDNTLWPAGMLLDSATGFNSAGSANGQYHIWFDYLEKTDVGPIYITCEGAWNGIRIQGPASPHTVGSGNMGGPVNFHGMKVEGRNEGAPCNGALIRVEGGVVGLRDVSLCFGMSSPATPGHSPQDAGIVHQIGGTLIADNVFYDKTASIALSVPLFYVASGEAWITHVTRGSAGGSWSTTRPTVNEVTASTVTADASVVVI